MVILPEGIQYTPEVSRAARPYIAGSLLVGGASLVVAMTTSSKVAMIVGFAGALFSAWACVGTITAALSSNTPQAFRDKIKDHVFRAIGEDTANALDFAARVAIESVIDAVCNRA